MLFWAQHVFWPRPFGCSSTIKNRPLGAPESVREGSKSIYFDFLRAYYHFKSHDFKENNPYKLKNASPKELGAMPEYYIMKKNLGMSQTVQKYMPNKSQIKNCFLSSIVQ